jgi:flagellar motor protein MotB
VIYFDTDSAVPIAGEAAKLADVPQYMTDYPDAVIDLEGYADERGSEDYNSDLASRRADAVRALLEASGIAADRIDDLVPVNETTEFGAGGATRRTPGNLRANRRVMIRFRRQASTLPVAS